MHKSTFTIRLQSVFYCGVLLLGLSAPAWSWDATGHMLIAQIAYDTMPPGVAFRIEQELKPLKYGLPPYNFITAASWMDDIKRDPRNPYRHLSLLHYADIPYSEGGNQFKIPPGKNAITGLEQTLIDLRKSTFDASVQAQHWAMVMHLAGDIHQPLHCTDHHDRGGNDVKITGIPNLPPDMKTHNLHFFWDVAYRYDVYEGTVRQLYPGVFTDKRPTNSTVGFIALQAGRLLQKYPPRKMKSFDSLDITNWARESYEEGCNFVYAPMINSGSTSIFLDADYVHGAHEIAARRIVLAGVRLGKLLTKLDAARRG